jgi:hypothetical protein
MSASAAQAQLFTHTAIGVCFGNLAVGLILTTCYFSFLVFKPVINVLFVSALASSIVRRRKLQIKALLETISSNPDYTSQVHTMLKSFSSRFMVALTEPTLVLQTTVDHPFIALLIMSSTFLYVRHLYHPTFLFLKTAGEPTLLTRCINQIQIKKRIAQF